MKKLLLLSLFTVISIFEIHAQGVEITPITGYTFPASYRITSGNARLGDGQNWGGNLGFSLNKNMEIELSYNYMSTRATASSPLITNRVDVRTNVHYAMIGANRLFPTSDAMTFFAGFKMGTGTLAFPDREYRNITKFSLGFQGGMKYFATERIGIRLQANLMMPVLAAGGSLWWSPGGGTAVGLSTFSPIVQFGFTGGIIFRLQQ
ncbi:porin family protein [Aquiflexum sp. TKW24L]|uniref:outer membrane beta-barrel protein n=1 Tax=Aquiflexum sp. TKW24L TaxID=2942212 RepID=UPI0020BEF5DB|nr:outer membrane beta-barrel protein [Aquiflexum sp. TKW24L]MCL6259044.1 porin family protein [Aquiflexum sp. TKW24L]